MIEKQRLETLIREGATIYDISSKEYVEQRKLNIFVWVCDDYLCFEKSEHLEAAYLRNLFETKEDAEFALRYKRIPKTEYLDLPIWEEIEEDGYYFEFNNSAFKVNKMENRILVLTNKNYLDLYDYIFDKPATKENYLEACEICRKLWLGEE